MNKKVLFISACLLLTGFSSFGQTSGKSHVSPDAVKKSPVLSEISGKIEAKEAVVAASSRGTAVELKDLYTSYSTELTKQMENTSSEEELNQLRQELRFAEKRKTELTTNH